MEYGQGGQDGGYNRGGYNQGGYNDGGYNHGNSDYNKPSQPSFNFGNGDNFTRGSSGGGGGNNGDGCAGCLIFLVYIVGILFVIPSAIAAISSGLLLMVVLKIMIKPFNGMSWWQYYKTAFYSTVVYLIVCTLLSAILYFINQPTYSQNLQNQALNPDAIKHFLTNHNLILRMGISTFVLHALCTLSSAGVLRRGILTYSDNNISYMRAVIITLIVILPCLIATLSLIIALAVTKGRLL